ncbi:jg12873 [Pararge aegeria aegeria]|uniref:Jg12873 protein n=1 Tax=Pararge aegeria aegeria TaxID=348720 RepID=A0A8S4RXV3_9NEOP|nr:jg12873 [Pararge aegeria aegeria]
MDEVIKTRNYRKHIMKDGTLDIGRACHRPGESLRHIVSGCSHLANGEYLHRHNQVARIVHQQLALRFGLIDFEMPYYRYDPASVLENSSALLYWDRTIITDRYITANRPDIVLVDRSVRRAIIVDITIPHDDNLVKAEKEKVSKYLDLAHEITAMWNVESTVVVPIVVSVNGLLAKSFDQHLKKLSLGCWIKGRIQKAVVLETARIVRRFLTLEP